MNQTTIEEGRPYDWEAEAGQEEWEIRHLMVLTGYWLEQLLGSESADRLMQQLQREVAVAVRSVSLDARGRVRRADRTEGEDDFRPIDWRNPDEAHDLDISTHPTLQRFWRLSDYGHRGLYSAHYDGDDPATDRELQADLEAADRFVRMLPEEWFTAFGADDPRRVLYAAACKEALHVASARYRLDSGADLSLADIACLARMALKSVKNATLRTGEEGLTVRSRGGPEEVVANQEARRWLKGRRGFVATEIAPARAAEATPAVEREELADYVFVPVARDGNHFSPAHRRDRGYQIGERLNEEYVADYFEALEKLNRMAVPRWRRPNEAGNWGIVSGVTWKRMEREALLRERTGTV